MAVPRLVTAFVDGDGERRGLHAGDFEWFGNQVLVRGRLAGITNAGTHREPPFDPCQECHAPGYMEGRLCGRIVKAKDDHLRGCRVTAAYRFRFEASTYFDDSPITGTIEGLIVCPCEDDDVWQSRRRGWRTAVERRPGAHTRGMPKLETITVKLTVPVVGEIEGVWRPDDSERAAAWEMYVELITRISVVQLKPGEGLLREALTSQYHLFEVTRDILRRYGPIVARPSDRSDLSFGYIAVTILNTVLRPILSSWHPELLAHEGRRHPQDSPTEHERRWELSHALRREIEDARTVLLAYADVLAEVAGVPSLVPKSGAQDGSMRSRDR